MVQTYDFSMDQWRIAAILADTLEGFSMDSPNRLVSLYGRLYAVSSGSQYLSVFESGDGVFWREYRSTFGGSDKPTIVASESGLYIVAGKSGKAANRFFFFDPFQIKFNELKSHSLYDDGDYNTCFCKNNRIFKINSSSAAQQAMEVFEISSGTWRVVPVSQNIYYRNNCRYFPIIPDPLKDEVYLFTPVRLDNGLFINTRSYETYPLQQDEACRYPVLVASDNLIFIIGNGDGDIPDFFCSFNPKSGLFSDLMHFSIHGSGRLTAAVCLQNKIIKLNSASLNRNELELYDIPSNTWTRKVTPGTIDFTNDGRYYPVVSDSALGETYWFESTFSSKGFFFNIVNSQFSDTSLAKQKE